MNASLQRTILGAAATGGLFRLVRWCHRDELLVLTYHSVIDVDEAVRRQHPLVYRNAVSAERFDRQMRFLRRHYRVLDGDALRAVLDGTPIPARSVVVTFDDGLLNNATVALPILRRHDVPAFFFLPTAFVDAATEGRQRIHWSEDLIARMSVRAADDDLDLSSVSRTLPELHADLASLSPDFAILRVVRHLKALPRRTRTERLRVLNDVLGDPAPPDQFPADRSGHSVLATMTWEHARTAAESGITLGGHTVNHEILARLRESAAAEEIRDSTRRIADVTEQPADLFAYPNGRPTDFTASHKTVLRETGCRGAFTQISGFNAPGTDPLALRRMDVSANYPLSTFRYVASGAKYWVDRFLRRRSRSQL